MPLDPHHKREDMRLLEMAVRKNWDIPEGVFRAWPSEIVQVVADKKNPLRERLRAMELMAKLHGQNLGQAEVVQQTLIQVNNSWSEADAEVAEQVRAMHATILGPEALRHLVNEQQPAAPGNGQPHQNGNGHSSNGNGKPH